MKMNRVVLLTGYRGLAETLIQKLKQNSQLSVLIRSKEALSTWKEKYPTVDFFLGDLSETKTGAGWIEHAIQRWGRIDALINNAAITGPPGKLHEISMQEIEETIAINLIAPIALIQKLLEYRNDHSLCVINLSGGGATIGRPKFSPYSITKTALVRMTENLALEYPEHRFYAISPGRLFTPMIEKVLTMDPNKVEPAELKEANNRRQGNSDSPLKAAEWIEWLIEKRPEEYNGMLLHAVWDDKEDRTRYPIELGWRKLRRIDTHTIQPLCAWELSASERLEKEEPR